MVVGGSTDPVFAQSDVRREGRGRRTVVVSIDRGRQVVSGEGPSPVEQKRSWGQVLYGPVTSPEGWM